MSLGRGTVGGETLQKSGPYPVRDERSTSGERKKIEYFRRRKI